MEPGLNGCEGGGVGALSAGVLVAAGVTSGMGTVNAGAIGSPAEASGE